jgi:hypothetical protein
VDLVRAGAVIIAAVGVELVRAARAALLKTAGPEFERWTMWLAAKWHPRITIIEGWGAIRRMRIGRLTMLKHGHSA